ncbi:phenoloxidase-activating factor 2-like [Battus philenor]|uniref:phenoloxidase-activating factor 2-like n=1 Tax=Battus philenor TaxID=42288 RepID=UPI0035D01B60
MGTMGYVACLLAAMLLQLIASESHDLDPETKAWLNGILSEDNHDNNSDTVDKSLLKIDPNTQEWLNSFLKPNTTEATTDSPMGSSTANVMNKFNTETLDQEFKENRVCLTEEGLDGVCVEYFQCDKGLVDNTTLIDLRDGSCPHYLQKCCLRSEAHRKPKIVPQTEGAGQCGWGNPGAGIIRINDEANINRQTYADFGEFPWMVALIKKEQDENSWSQSNYLGGGSIIHPSVVITAAHKVDRYIAREIKCRAGEWDTQTTKELYQHQERDVTKMIMHEEFYHTPTYNDIALLVLKTPFTLENAPHIGVACLAPQLPAPGTQCYSMGWGREFQHKNKNAVILKKVKLPFIDSATCSAALKRTRLGPRYDLHASHMCAGGVVGVDTCRGDGGSSLVCPIMHGPDSDRFAVYGMVVFGVGCGTAAPGVYANVPHLYSWVDEKMNKEGFGTTSYKY